MSSKLKTSLRQLNDALFTPVWKERDLSVIDKFCASDVDVHTTFYQGQGIADVHKSFEILFETFTEFNLQVEDLLEYDGRITYKWSAKAKHNHTNSNEDYSKSVLEFNGIVFLVFNEHGFITKYHSFSNMPQIMLATPLVSHLEKYAHDIESVAQQWSDLLFAVAKQMKINLTYREIECLYYWIAGYSIKETARKLGGLSGKTVQVFRNNINKKFNVMSFHELIKLLHTNQILNKLLDAQVEGR
jgi:DNA-binding CsgD family transcriptional regulator